MAELNERGRHFLRKRSNRRRSRRPLAPWTLAPEASRTRVLRLFRLPEPSEGRITRAWEACLSKKAPEYVFWTAQGPRTRVLQLLGLLRPPAPLDRPASRPTHFSRTTGCSRTSRDNRMCGGGIGAPRNWIKWLAIRRVA